MGTLNEPATTVHADAQVFDSEHLPDTVTGRADKSLPQLTRDERRAVVGEMREAGMSNVAIGSAVGVNEKTIRNDLAASEFSDPDTTTGRDGKTYPARRTPAEANDVGDEAPSQAA